MADEVDLDVPETHVLAVASHVTSGYVGNTMATFCMQTLGCEVSAIHTVNYSNHVAYRRFTGTATSPSDLVDLYNGLKSARLDDFDMMLSGYCPSAQLVEEVGKIGREQRLRARTKPGSFFWVLDPVMGDNGRVYVKEECVPVYRRMVRDADLVLPNQFEAELLSEVKIEGWRSLETAMKKLHQGLGVPNVVVTSVRLPHSGDHTPEEGARGQQTAPQSKLSVIGSTATSDGKPRLFRVVVPALPVFFSGTGDMFAALLVARLREAAQKSSVLNQASWRSPDEVEGLDLPLAKATEKVLASMHAVLKDTERHYESVKKAIEEERELNAGKGKEAEEAKETERHLRLTRAAEVRVVRNSMMLREPPNLEDFRAKSVAMEDDVHDGAGESVDELGVLKVSGGQGAIHQT